MSRNQGRKPRNQGMAGKILPTPNHCGCVLFVEEILKHSLVVTQKLFAIFRYFQLMSMIAARKFYWHLMNWEMNSQI